MKEHWILDRLEDGKAVFESEGQDEVTAELSDVSSVIVMGGSYSNVEGKFIFDPTETEARNARIAEKRNLIFKNKNPDQ